jgi:hypothetical protein
MRFAILLAMFGLIAIGAQAQTPAAAPDATAPAPTAPTAPAVAPALAPEKSAPSHAQHVTTHTRTTMAQRFAAANTTHDGHLTEAQAKAGLPAIYRHFGEIDSAHKGYVTTADLKAYDHAQYVKRSQAKKVKAAAPAPASAPPATASQ